MSEYRLVLPKTPQGGFAESPQQDIGNAGSPALNNNLTVKNGIGLGVAAMYGKKVATTGFNAIVGQVGSTRLEEAISIGTKLLGYGGIALVNPALAVGAAAVDGLTIAIDMAVETHKNTLENERIIASRGVRRVKSGVYYG